MQRRTKDLFLEENIFLEAVVQQDDFFFKDENNGMEFSKAQDSNISEESNSNPRISSENDQSSGENPPFELKTMPFKQQFKLFLSHLRKSILKRKNIFPEYFFPSFQEKVNYILKGKRSSRNIDISHFLEFWILISDFDDYVGGFKERIIQIIEKIRDDLKKSRKEKIKKIQQISQRILECIFNFQQHRDLSLLSEDLWGPKVKKTNFNNFMSKIPRMKESSNNWISSNMNAISRIAYEK